MSQIEDDAKEATEASVSHTISRLADILLASLTSLAAAGEVEATCRLAGRAYMALQDTDRKAARRFDVLLHRLIPKLNW